MLILLKTWNQVVFTLQHHLQAVVLILIHFGNGDRERASGNRILKQFQVKLTIR